MKQAKAEPYRYPQGQGGKNERRGNAAWRQAAIACGLCVWMTASFSLAQVAEQSIWPPAGSGLWYWIVPKTDLALEQVDAAFKKAIAEEMAFLDPGYGASVFFAKKIRLTKGKSKDRKKYPDQPELHYLPNLRERFPKAPEGRNWNVNMLAGSLYNFFFGTEDSARNFINAVASVLEQRGLDLTFSKFGLMWENVTPAQAADLGKSVGESVLITMVAIAGPGDRAGIQPLDVILEVNGSKVKNFSHFSLLLDGISPGTKASLVLLRRLKAPNTYPEQYSWNPLTVEMEAR
jgi:hypothetical protein